MLFAKQQTDWLQVYIQLRVYNMTGSIAHMIGYFFSGEGVRVPAHWMVGPLDLFMLFSTFNSPAGALGFPGSGCSSACRGIHFLHLSFSREPEEKMRTPDGILIRFSKFRLQDSAFSGRLGVIVNLNLHDESRLEVSHQLWSLHLVCPCGLITTS